MHIHKKEKGKIGIFKVIPVWGKVWMHGNGVEKDKENEIAWESLEFRDAKHKNSKKNEISKDRERSK